MATLPKEPPPPRYSPSGQLYDWVQTCDICGEQWSANTVKPCPKCPPDSGGESQ